MTLPQQTSQQQSQHFLLKWNNHRSNMVNVFESLLTAENLVDVTLAVEGKFLKAHKIVLSASSPYFQAMFVNHSPSDRYPILILHDIKFVHLKTLLDFMYRGEISIDEKDLGDVLKVAEALSIRGLSSFENDEEEGDSKQDSSSEQPPPPPPPTNGHATELNNGGGAQTSSQTQHKSSHKQKGTKGEKSKNKASCGTQSNETSNHAPAKRHHVESSTDVPKKKVATASTSPAPAVAVDSEVPKKKRGRAKKIVLDASSSSTQNKPSPTNQSPTKLHPRQGVRRRIPRRYAGIPTRLKRVKLGKNATSDSTSDPQPPYDEMDEALLQQMLEGEDCEPLSEMSVRGLDLFKYASVEEGVYRCIECDKLRIPKTFKNKYSFQRHAFLYHEGNMRKVFPCPVCSREFSRPDKMKNHMRSVHDTSVKEENGGVSKVEQDDVSSHAEEGVDVDNCDS